MIFLRLFEPTNRATLLSVVSLFAFGFNSIYFFVKAAERKIG